MSKLESRPKADRIVACGPSAGRVAAVRAVRRWAVSLRAGGRWTAGGKPNGGVDVVWRLLQYREWPPDGTSVHPLAEPLREASDGRAFLQPEA